MPPPTPPFGIAALVFDRHSLRHLGGRIPSSLDALAVLHDLYYFLPSPYQIRPTEAQRAEKVAILAEISNKWQSVRDFVFCSYFARDSYCGTCGGLVSAGSATSDSLPTGESVTYVHCVSATPPCAGAVLHADGAFVDTHGVLSPNTFPYALDEGAQHAAMWYAGTVEYVELPMGHAVESLPYTSPHTSEVQGALVVGATEHPPRDAVRTLTDADITRDVARHLAAKMGGRVPMFGWYVNPKMSVPEVFHVQVFYDGR